MDRRVEEVTDEAWFGVNRVAREDENCMPVTRPIKVFWARNSNEPTSLQDDIPDGKLAIYVQIERFFGVREIPSPATQDNIPAK